jgi:hypothetical protein
MEKLGFNNIYKKQPTTSSINPTLIVGQLYFQVLAPGLMHKLDQSNIDRRSIELYVPNF